MIDTVKGESRGKTTTDWLDSFHSFSFAEYYDPENINFGPLRVLNHDYVAPSSGFPTHPHNNMEIITYVLKGTLTHSDSMGTKKTIVKNEVQMMTAGTGIYHSEYNYSADEPVELLQIWIVPEKRNLNPTYSQKLIPEGAADNKLYKIVSHKDGDGLLKINQEAEVYLSRLTQTREIEHPVGKSRGVYIYLIEGEINVNDNTLKNGDAVKILLEESVKIRANEDSEFILFDIIV